MAGRCLAVTGWGGTRAHVRVEVDVSMMMLSLAAQEHKGSLSDAEICTCTAGGISLGGDQVCMHIHVRHKRYAVPMWAKSWAAFQPGQHASGWCEPWSSSKKTPSLRGSIHVPARD